MEQDYLIRSDIFSFQCSRSDKTHFRHTLQRSTGREKVKTNIEAIAIKNLQDILRERGYTAETLFSKFDTDGNGVLSKMEFEAALRSITGQVAPQAILNAVFGALDRDSSGSLELAELLSIVDSGVTHSFSSGQSIVVGGHPQDRFNGTYSQQEGTMNGKPFFKNQSGCLLYAFSSGSSASSWNLDDRDQNGSNDWYRGGWTRAPPDGSVPLGVRRWVGVGKLSLTPVDQGANIDTGSAANETSDPVDAEFPENNQQLADLLSEFDSALNYFEGKVTSGELSVDQAMEMANTAFERKSSELPPVLRFSAQKVWEKKASALENGELQVAEAPPVQCLALIADLVALGFEEHRLQSIAAKSGAKACELLTGLKVSYLEKCLVLEADNRFELLD